MADPAREEEGNDAPNARTGPSPDPGGPGGGRAALAPCPAVAATRGAVAGPANRVGEADAAVAMRAQERAARATVRPSGGSRDILASEQSLSSERQEKVRRRREKDKRHKATRCKTASTGWKSTRTFRNA